MENVKIILASQSPRRRAMLAWVLMEFDCRPADIDETPLEGEQPTAYCRRMALGKALKCAESVTDDALIIGSDTTVFVGTRIFGKPKDEDDAAEMLRTLNGRDHKVGTAAVVIAQTNGKRRVLRSYCETGVRLRAMDRDEIRDYVASGDPMDKAGAYAIQNRAFHPVESIHGCYAGVVGLPLCHVCAMLRAVGCDSFPPVRPACMGGTNRNCSCIPAVNIEELDIAGSKGVR